MSLRSWRWSLTGSLVPIAGAALAGSRGYDPSHLQTRRLAPAAAATREGRGEGRPTQTGPAPPVGRPPHDPGGGGHLEHRLWLVVEGPAGPGLLAAQGDSVTAGGGGGHSTGGGLAHVPVGQEVCLAATGP